jgi:hypothetical protein
MSTNINLAPIDTGTKGTNFDPNAYFNNLSFSPLDVGVNVSHAVQSFFEKITDNKKSAEILASAVIFTSASQGIDPMQTLDEFMKLPPGDLNDFLVTFLNFNRIGTSLLGLINTSRPGNQFVKRAILL